MRAPMGSLGSPKHADRFRERRRRLAARVGAGVIVIPGHPEHWRNADNPFPFRQSSHLLYVAPVSVPGAALVIDTESGEEALFAPPPDPGDVVWHGPRPSIEEEAARVGLERVRDIAELPGALRAHRDAKRFLHFPPLFIPQIMNAVAEWLGIDQGEVGELVSHRLIDALGEMRLRKDETEVAEIERALSVTAEMFAAAFVAARPGRTEAEVRAELSRVAHSHDLEFSFAPIVTVRGEVLHNHSYGNTLADEDLLLIDAGLETPAGYASDITRTVPVSGAFTGRQRDIYELVLVAQGAALAAMRPGVRYRDVHDLASLTIARGLTDLGLMRGDPEEAVALGAHALFFVHGLGHPLGLDVHDLHDLGDRVAYTPDNPRSHLFGTQFLRFGRELDEGMVMTVEPGIYFIPSLIDDWKATRRFTEFIDYSTVEDFRGFGGIRVEDDVLVTAIGIRELGPGIPRTLEDVEAALLSD